MGQDHKVCEVSSVSDLENAVTGDYDYIIRITRDNAKCPYLKATVSSHDAPLGVSYVMVPVDVLHEAMEDDSIREEYEKYKESLKEEEE